MGIKRKSFSADFKAKVALEAIRGISTTADSDFCVRCPERALETDKPEIFNTDQGSQYTSKDFEYYNCRRRHSRLDARPVEIYFAAN